MSDIAEAVGKRIYAIRTSKHMSRKDLAKRSGLHLTYIGQLERGERNATLATLESVSYALNVPIERFVEYITPGMASQETAANECYNLILGRHRARKSVFLQFFKIWHSCTKYNKKTHQDQTMH